MAVAFLGLGLAAPLYRGGMALAAPARSLAHAGSEVVKVLSPCAYLSGPFAHALTYECGLRRKYIPRLEFGGGKLGAVFRREGITHLAVDLPRDPEPFFNAFRADGAELEPVWDFTVRGTRVGLFRFPWASALCPPSDFERGMAALRAGRRTEGEEQLRRALAGRERFASASSALGSILVEDGRQDEGVARLEDALRWNPDELHAARALVGFHLKRGEHSAARTLLLHIARSDPLDLEAARLAETLGALR